MGRARITALTAAAAALLQPDAARALSARRTPVMGWSTWSVYGCDISEQKIKEQALAIDALGLRALGYEYIDIDDCWQAYSRSADGVQQANASLFPSGMKALADWLHARGFKLGLCEQLLQTRDVDGVGVQPWPTHAQPGQAVQRGVVGDVAPQSLCQDTAITGLSFASWLFGCWFVCRGVKVAEMLEKLCLPQEC